jgi:hypothetical protein
LMRCRNCGHLITKTNNQLHHKLSNHSMYCPCRKPEICNAEKFFPSGSAREFLRHLPK